ncbi:hypothetical protein GEV33_012367 [Tenebrio molitor]|uniref:Uncharacterized protein n=1 Tax=Tenebrio molitor TaxID=7067 RepID=A0A8J6H968_TENMO|nr:hypothetical protein GEV33_012367 [Tenebrio molitor]
MIVLLGLENKFLVETVRPLFDYSTSNGQEAKLQTASSNSGGSRHQVRLNNCAGDWRLELLHSRAVTVVNDISRVVDRIASDGSTPNLLHIYQRTRGSSGGLPGLIWDYDLGQSACKQHPSRDSEFFPGTGRPTRVARWTGVSCERDVIHSYPWTRPAPCDAWLGRVSDILKISLAFLGDVASSLNPLSVDNKMDLINGTNAINFNFNFEIISDKKAKAESLVLKIVIPASYSTVGIPFAKWNHQEHYPEKAFGGDVLAYPVGVTTRLVVQTTPYNIITLGLVPTALLNEGRKICPNLHIALRSSASSHPSAPADEVRFQARFQQENSRIYSVDSRRLSCVHAPPTKQTCSRSTLCSRH